MTDHEAVARVLDDAADLIERDGWCQRQLGTPDGRVCTMGAIAKTLGCYETQPSGFGAWGNDYHVTALVQSSNRALVEVIEADPALLWPVPAWNDDPARTKQEVLDALRAAAKSELKAADEAAS